MQPDKKLGGPLLLSGPRCKGEVCWGLSGGQGAGCACQEGVKGSSDDVEHPLPGCREKSERDKSTKNSSSFSAVKQGFHCSKRKSSKVQRMIVFDLVWLFP